MEGIHVRGIGNRIEVKNPAMGFCGPWSIGNYFEPARSSHGQIFDLLPTNPSPDFPQNGLAKESTENCALLRKTPRVDRRIQLNPTFNAVKN